MTNIVVWGRFQGVADELPKLLSDDHVVVPKEDAQLDQAKDAEVGVGTNQGDRVRALLRAAPDLRWYHSIGAGVEDLVGIPERRPAQPFAERNAESHLRPFHQSWRYVAVKYLPQQPFAGVAANPVIRPGYGNAQD